MTRKNRRGSSLKLGLNCPSVQARISCGDAYARRLGQSPSLPSRHLRIEVVAHPRRPSARDLVGAPILDGGNYIPA